MSSDNCVKDENSSITLRAVLIQFQKTSALQHLRCSRTMMAIRIVQNSQQFRRAPSNAYIEGRLLHRVAPNVTSIATCRKENSVSLCTRRCAKRLSSVSTRSCFPKLSELRRHLNLIVRRIATIFYWKLNFCSDLLPGSRGRPGRLWPWLRDDHDHNRGCAWYRRRPRCPNLFRDAGEYRARIHWLGDHHLRPSRFSESCI